MDNIMDVMKQLFVAYASKQIDLNTFYQKLAEAVAEHLEIQRVGFWFVDASKGALIAHENFDATVGGHSSGLELFMEDAPTYFGCLDGEGKVIANNVHAHPATHEIDDAYYEPHRIEAVIDVAIKRDGNLYGVIRCEQAEQERIWLESDIKFAEQIAAIISKVS